MPFKSKAQRDFLFANKPDVAKKFAADSKKDAEPSKNASKDSPWMHMKISIKKGG